jgi:peptidoglycan/xylan/chitin deacetylase (PgdA/CDA1 family)
MNRIVLVALILILTLLLGCNSQAYDISPPAQETPEETPVVTQGPPSHTWDSTLGWDFEDHSNDHLRFGELTEAQVRAQEEGVDAAFTEHGYPVPQHFAYPYGNYSQTSQLVISQYRKTCRVVWGEMLTYPVKNWSVVKAAQLVSNTTWEEAKGWVDKCITTDSLLHIFTHDVSEKPSEYGVTPQMLAQLVDYLAQQQNAGELKVMTMAEAYDYWSNAKQGNATVVVSFDDAHESDYTIAYPLFKEKGLKGTSYVTTSYVGRKGHLTWDEIAEMRSGKN